jgi:NAD(P)-dependent dehydrogenase (short-subunit alcohol dehydrogenase family)
MLIKRWAKPRYSLTDIDLPTVERVAATLPAGHVLPLACDVTDIDSVHDAVKRTIDEFGPIDVTIANAGILGHGSTFRALVPDDANRVMTVNVAGVVNTVSATIESIIRTRGQIVLISSVFAYINGAGAVPYAVSRAAVGQLGRGLGVELAHHGASAMTAYFSLVDTGVIHHSVDAACA